MKPDDLPPELAARVPYLMDVGRSILDDLAEHYTVYFMTDPERIMRIDEYGVTVVQADLEYMMGFLIDEKYVTVLWSQQLPVRDEYQDKVGQHFYPIVITDKGLEAHREFRARWTESP